jgi:hypothetical protein
MIIAYLRPICFVSPNKGYFLDRYGFVSMFASRGVFWQDIEIILIFGLEQKISIYS